MDLSIRLVDGSVAHILLLAPGSRLELEKYLECWKLEVPCA